MPREEDLIVQKSDLLDRQVRTCRIHRELGRSFGDSSTVKAEDVPGKECACPLIEQADAAGRMPGDRDAEKAVDTVPVFQEDIRLECVGFQDCPDNAQQEAGKSGVNGQGVCSADIPGIGVAYGDLRSGRSFFECNNPPGMVHVEMGDDDCPDLPWIAVQFFPDIGEDLLPAAGNPGIDYCQAIADNDITVPVDPVNHVNARYNLHNITQEGVRIFWVIRFAGMFCVPKLAGYNSPEELIGMNVRDVYVDPAERNRFLSLVTEKGAVAGYPLRLRRRDGSVRFVTASSHFYLAPDGSIQGLEGIIHDITELKQAEDALRMANKKLNLLSTVTRHDIRNQLMALKAYLELNEEAIDKPSELAVTS